MSLHPDFVHELQRATSGDLRTDPVTRTLYSTDASIYQIEPKGVFIPKTQDELQAAVELAAKYKIPILPRGSGSSLAGQAVGDALILDLSRYLDKILDIDPEARTALVEPGVILSDLNRVAAKHGLGFGPDPASADRATMGGVLGNNATGAHSIRYGMAADHLLAADVLLADGMQTAFSEISLERASQIAQDIQETASFPLSSFLSPPNLEATLYAAALHIRAQYAETIQKRWTKVWRNTSGYRLNYLLPWSPSHPPQWEHERYPNLKPSTLNLATLLAGSEGTLAVMQRMTLNLVPLQREKVLVVLSFNSIPEAMDAVPALLESQPSAIELLPRLLIDLAREVPAYAPLIDFVDDSSSELLVVEYAGDDQALVRKQAQIHARSGRVITDKTQQANIWKVRKVGLGILSTSTSATRGVTFIEDCSVPVEHLGDYVRGMEKIFTHFNTGGVFYAHASAGVLHMRPVLNLQSERGQRELREMAEAVLGLVLSLGGAMTGEHGDGLARSEFLEKIYGEEINEVFRVLKLAADPENLLNPGKIVSPPPMDENLRYGAEYTAKPFTVNPVLDFSREGGLVNAIENCNGAGVCRGFSGTMCPSFQATREESHATRGRANMLRAWISGEKLTAKTQSAQSFSFFSLKTWRSSRLGGLEKDVANSLDLCLACKGCKSECPSGVDMAKLKYEFFNHYYKSHSRKLRDYLFGYIGVFAKVGAPFGMLVNQVLGNQVIGNWAKKLMGVARERQLPKFTQYATRNQNQVSGTRYQVDRSDPETVIFLPDAFTRYFEPEIEAAAMQVLRAAGLHVITLPVLGAGRTLISKSFLNAAKKHAQKVRDEIAKVDPEGKVPVVGVEPSEIYTLKDEYLDFFPQDKSVQALAKRAWLIDEFLLRKDENGESYVMRIARLINKRRKRNQTVETSTASANQKSAKSAQSVDETLGTEKNERNQTVESSTASANQKSAKSAQSVDETLGTEKNERNQTVETSTASASQKSAKSAQSVDENLRAEALTTREVDKISLHGHCYQKARPPADDGLPVGQDATAELLRAVGYEVKIIPSGCCGMAGSFGYEKEHVELSMKVGELVLFPAIRQEQALNGSVSVAAPGTSCREQIAAGTGVAAQHPMALVAALL